MLYVVALRGRYLGVLDWITASGCHILLEGWTDNPEEATLYEDVRHARQAAQRFTTEAACLTLTTRSEPTTPSPCAGKGP